MKLGRAHATEYQVGNLMTASIGRPGKGRHRRWIAYYRLHGSGPWLAASSGSYLVPEHAIAAARAARGPRERS